MHAFSPSVEVVISGRHGRRRLLAGTDLEGSVGLDPKTVILAFGGAERLCRERLAERHPGEEAALRHLTETDLVAWPGWPVRLGRDPSAPDGAPLACQLEHLRALRPGRRHFRIAIVGGFGMNLGDMLIGATAWRAAASVLAATLPNFTADVLLGLTAHPALASFVERQPGIGEVRFAPINLLEFARYDAYFDFGSLVRLPRFHDGAHLDWVLWWLGLDPATVPAQSKRNQLRLPAAALTEAQARLNSLPGPKVGFVWRASVPLRSMSPEQAARFARELLEVAPDITLVTEQRVDLDHERLVQVEAGDAFQMMGLIVSLDGLVTIDSLAPHVADAADVPTVMILNSFPPSRFPHYPNMTITTPPVFGTLPGWGLTKVDDDAWSEMAEDYAKAWSNVSAEACWRLLAASMASPRSSPRREVEIAAPPVWRDDDQLTRAFPHDLVTPRDLWATDKITHLAKTFLEPGHVAVVAGGGESLAVRLARVIAPTGTLHVMEPRRLRAQAIAAAAYEAKLQTLHIYGVIAGDQAGKRHINDFDPAGEGNPFAWGNVPEMVEAEVAPLDALNLPECRLIIVRPPHIWREMLDGAAELIVSMRPVIIIGGVDKTDHADLRARMSSFNYVAGLSVRVGGQVGEGVLLLAAPREMEAHLEHLLPL